MRQARWILVSVAWCVSFSHGASAADDDFFLKNGERVLFLGDSITQAAGYVNDVELFLLTRFPKHAFTIINHGISSETLSGTSEPDHDPPRPCALDRFERDVAAWNPDVVVACFGMNDGNYRPPNAETQARFEAGVHRLIELVQTRTHARLVLLTPPPFDPYRRQVSDPEAEHYGYKFPAVDYNDALAAFRRLVIARAQPGVSVSDVWARMQENLEAGRAQRASYHLAADGVHPNPAGHTLMATVLLKAWGARGTRDNVTIEKTGTHRCTESISQIIWNPESLRFLWSVALPWHADVMTGGHPWWAGTLDSLNARTVQIKGLDEGEYFIRARNAGSKEWAITTRAQVVNREAGLTLNAAEWPNLGLNARFDALRQALTQRNAARYAAWRQALLKEERENDHASPGGDEHATAQLMELARPALLEVDLRRQ